MPLRIEDYALISDCETAALVGRDGSIDWLCWPRFDSAACFAALLGTPDHGRRRVAPAAAPCRITRRYRDGTLILETRFELPDGSAATVIDFMPIRGAVSDLVRIVAGERGQVPMRMELVVRFDFGSSVPWVTRLENGALRAIAGPNMAVLRTPRRTGDCSGCATTSGCWPRNTIRSASGCSATFRRPSRMSASSTRRARWRARAAPPPRIGAYRKSTAPAPMWGTAAHRIWIGTRSAPPDISAPHAGGLPGGTMLAVHSRRAAAHDPVRRGGPALISF